MSVKVLDANKKVIRVLGAKNDVSRGIYHEIIAGRGKSFIPITPQGNILSWDGKVYDKVTGEYKNAPEGQYYIQIESKRMVNSMPQVIIMPVKIDVTKPEISDYEVKKENDGVYIYIKPVDNCAIANEFYYDVETTDGSCQTLVRKYVYTEVDEQGRYYFNLGKIDNIAKINVMIEDMAGNSIFKEIYNELSENEKDDVQEEYEPPIDVLEQEIFTKVYCIKDYLTVTLADNLTYPCSFRIKIPDDEACIESFKIKECSLEEYITDNFLDEITFDDFTTLSTKPTKTQSYMAQESEDDSQENKNITYKYEGNGIYTVTLLRKTDGLFRIRTTDKDGNIGSELMYLCENEEQYGIIIKYLVDEMFLDLEKSGVSKTDLNEDKTYTITGWYKRLAPEELRVNGILAKVNKEERRFSVNIPLSGGINKVKFESNYGGVIRRVYTTLYYNDMNIQLNGLPKEDSQGVINVNSDKLNLQGTITSCVSIGSIKINGDNIYSASDSRSYPVDKPLVKDFNYVVDLQKGMNNITIEVTDGGGNEVMKKLKVNCK